MPTPVFCDSCGEPTFAFDGICDECYFLMAADWDYDEPEDHLSDAEADSMTLASAGWGTDEDYGYFGDY